LDQKSHNLLQQLVEEAPQKKIDSLVKRLNDGRIQANKKRYILNCLKTIGNAAAIEDVEMFYEANKNNGLAASYAGEIIAEMSAGKSPKAELQKTEKSLFKIYPPSFLNPDELNAEYICIPEGSYRYSVSGNMETVPYLYFAKYPVTNKRYRSFISYLAGKKTEITDSLSLTEFQEQLLRVASNIKDFSHYIGNDPEKWPVNFRSNFEEEKRFKDDDQPVVAVSWYDAKSYCLWLSLMSARESKLEFKEATGLFRLPTEFEWEWAAAGRESDGSLRKYPWPVNKGEPSDKLANYDENVGATTPVGRYPVGASPEGLLDMAGNVWEWMENWYQEDEDYRASRGGSWGCAADYLRCSARGGGPADRGVIIGFRVVRAQS
jgi:formylglycine-generating enzyme required for sulfatase activity